MLLLNIAFNFDMLSNITIEKTFVSLVVGGVIGWLYGLALHLLFVSNSALDRLNELSCVVDFQKGPLSLILSAKRHAKSIDALLNDSVREQYKCISNVDENRYLSYLMTAISYSNRYDGIQRNPIRWFLPNNTEIGEEYLKYLRDKQMDSKRRIFIVKNGDEMVDDICDDSTLSYYWENTGKDMKTFWITEDDFNRSYNKIQIPDDFALYDSELIIQYNEKSQTLFFNIENANSKNLELFERLDEQLRLGLSSPFKEIKFNGNNGER